MLGQRKSCVVRLGVWSSVLYWWVWSSVLYWWVSFLLLLCCSCPEGALVLVLGLAEMLLCSVYKVL